MQVLQLVSMQVSVEKVLEYFAGLPGHEPELQLQAG